MMPGPARDERDVISPMRWYGGSIAIVSGVYAVIMSMIMPEMTQAGWFMLVLGLIVLVHGILLVTPLVLRWGDISGPLMLLYAALMLLQQAWLAIRQPEMEGMNGMMETGTMTWDPGMVALALLMLISGLIMTAHRDGMKAQPTPEQ